MNHAHQIYRARRDAVPAVDALAQRRRHRAGPDRPRDRPQSRLLYPFRHDSYFDYLSGFPEPEAVVALVAGPRATGSPVLPRARTKSARSGTARYGPDPRARDLRLRRGASDRRAARKAAGDRLPTGRQCSRRRQRREWDRQVTELLNEVRAACAPASPRRRRSSTSARRSIRCGWSRIAHELAMMRRACAISVAAHRARWSARPASTSTRSRPSSLHGSARRRAAVAYSSIVASGPNACVLHYRDNNRQMHDGDLLLIDAGCESRAMPPTSRARFPSAGDSAARRRRSTSSCSRRSSHASMR